MEIVESIDGNQFCKLRGIRVNKITRPTDALFCLRKNSKLNPTSTDGREKRKPTEIAKPKELEFLCHQHCTFSIRVSNKEIKW